MNSNCCFSLGQLFSPCESMLLPQHGLSLVPFADVLANKGDFNFLIDVMGLLIGSSTEREYVRDGKLTKMVVIELLDCIQKLECELFGPYVEELNAFLAEGDIDLPVVVIQLAKMKVFRGKIVIQNIIYASKITFNPSIAEES